jgi:SSS family solute:Na+ symporter
VLDGIENETIREQQTVTVALVHMLPVGLLGIFAAVMFAAFVSTHDTYLHAWGSIFVQDVVLPIRLFIRRDNKPMSQEAHLKLLRASILGVAVFIFLFSLFFSQQQDILMFFALTGTFYLGWAGWTICGGLYWKYGNSAGAWVGAIVGLVLSVSGWFVMYYWGTAQVLFERLSPSFWSWVVEAYPEFAGDKCPITAQVLYFWSMVVTGVAYIGASLLVGRKAFNMDRMLHRGKYAVEQDTEDALPKRGWQALKMDKMFKWDDKVLYVSSLGYTFALFGLFLVGTLLFTVFGTELSDAFWGNLWWWYIVIMLIFIATVTTWLAIGGFIDLGQLFRDLAKVKRDADDDGTVVGRESLADLHARDTRGGQSSAS